MSDIPNVPVVIVGAGPAGLTAALFLARQGVPALVLERHAALSPHPRARGLNVRTMEIYRGAGLEAAIEHAGAALAASKYMLFVETLAGKEIRRISDADLIMTGERLAALTPCTWVQCAQDDLEPLLLATARQAGAEVRFGMEVVALTEAPDGVSLTLRTVATGALTELHATYMLAADGAHSMVRSALAISMTEQAVQGHYVNIFFRADLRPYVTGREFALCFVETPAAPGMFLAVNNTDRWLFNAEYNPDTDSPARFTPAYCLNLIRAAVGVADLPVEILSVLPWEASAQCVTRMQSQRIFLLGDAAHTMPPAGGLGLNTGVAEAHNLAWKLALVLQGKATPKLLSTYEDERLPLAQHAVEQAARELNAERPDGPPTDTGTDFFIEQLLPILGGTYVSSAVVTTDRETTEGLHLDGRPGTRLPHVWLERAGQRVSTLDLIQGAFVAVLGSQGELWRDLMQEQAVQHRVPLMVYRVAEDGDLHDLLQNWEATAGITDMGMLLVRPDGIVAWRTRDAIAQTKDMARRVFAQILGG